MRLLSSIAAVAAVAAATCTVMAKECQYCSSGPCVPTEVLNASYQTHVDPGKNAKLSLTVTIPGNCQSIQGPYPVILYLNGFQVKTSRLESLSHKSECLDSASKESVERKRPSH